MAITSDSIGLLFRAKGDTDDAKKAFNSLRTQISGDVDAIESKGKSGFSSFAQSMGLSETQATKLAGAMPIIGAAVAGLAVGVAAATGIIIQGSIALFNLTKQASEYGSAIFDAQGKTGLSAITLTTLKLNADNAGSSLEQVVGSIGKFVKGIGAANDGNEKAQKTLKDLGVTSKDLDGALSQVIKTIAEAPPGIEQMTLAQKAFGKSGADLIPVIEQMNGDLEEAKKQAEFWGTTLTEKDIRASDDFGDALGLLSAQASAAAVAFTSDLMPVMTAWFTSISRYYAQNKDEVRAWGSTIASIVSGIGSTFQTVFQAIKTYSFELQVALRALIPQMLQILWDAEQIILKYLFAKGEANKVAGGGAPAEGGGRGSITGTATMPGGPGGGKGGGRSGKSDAQKAADAQLKKDLQDQIDLQRLNLKEYEKAYKETLERIRTEFKKTGDANALVKAADEALTKFREATQVANDLLNELGRQQAGTQSEAGDTLMTRQEMARVADLNEFIKKEVDKTNELIVDSDAKAAKQRIEIDAKLTRELRDANQKRQDSFIKSEEDTWDGLIEDQQGFIDEQNKLRGEASNYMTGLFERERDRQLFDLDIEYKAEKDKIDKEVRDEEQKQKLIFDLDELYKQKRLLTEDEFQKQKKAIEEKYSVPVGAGTTEESGGFFSGLVGGMGTSIEAMMQKVEPLKGIGNIIGSQFNLIAQAVGNAVKAFVLFGSAGGSFKKFAAEMMASIAQMAIVQAVWELAQGFAMLALAFFGSSPGAMESAIAHFQAAAIYGVVGGVAAIAGRGIAGDSFKQQAGIATGSAGASSSSGHGGTGGAYSSKEGSTIDASRNATGGLFGNQKIELTLHLDPDGVLDVVGNDVRRDGRTRKLILETVPG